MIGTDMNVKSRSVFYSLSVGNIGMFGCGKDRNLAIAEFHKYVDMSKNEIGRAAGESVFLFESGIDDPIMEHTGHFNLD